MEDVKVWRVLRCGGCVVCGGCAGWESADAEWLQCGV